MAFIHPLASALPAALLSSQVVTDVIDLLAVLLLALGIKGLSKVSSARSANALAAVAMGLEIGRAHV